MKKRERKNKEPGHEREKRLLMRFLGGGRLPHLSLF
jgi:hypothetical protein